MKATIPSAGALAAALSSAMRTIEKRNTVPVLANVLIQADGAQVTLTGTNLVVRCIATVKAEIAQPGGITVPAELLHAFASKLPKGAAVMLETIGGRLQVRTGRSKATLSTLPVDDFPDFAPPQGRTFPVAPAKALVKLIASVAHAMSAEESRYYLVGIFLHAREPGVLRAAATDGHRLARAELSVDGMDAWDGAIIPRKAIEILRPLLAAYDGDVIVSVDERAAQFAFGDTVFSTKLIDGTFPEYGRVIPVGNNVVAKIDRDELSAAVSRLQTFTSAVGRAIKFEFGEDHVRMSARIDSGDAVETIECQHSGTPITIGFNAEYLASHLSVLACDMVTIAMSDAGTPAILTGEDDGGLLLLLSPLRV